MHEEKNQRASHTRASGNDASESVGLIASYENPTDKIRSPSPFEVLKMLM